MRQIFKDIEKGIVPGIDAFVDALSDVMPLLNELVYTDQDEVWHAEGDVHTHTDMVLEELEFILAEEAAWLDDQRRLALVLSGALHDIAKPITTKLVERNGRTCLICPNHEEKGRSYVLRTLMEMGLEKKTVLLVANLVGYHQMPNRLVRKDASEAEYRLLSRQVDPQLLYFLEKADMKGRICDDMAKNLESLELFRMRLEELDLWENEMPYEDWFEVFNENDISYARGASLMSIHDFEMKIISSPEEGLARSYRLKDGYAKLVITCGPSGSGKSSWIEALGEEWEIISLDNLRFEMTGKRSRQKDNGTVLQHARTLLKQYLSHNKNIVWDATSLRKDHRAALIQTGIKYGALVSIRAYIAPEKILYQRNSKRINPVPEKVLSKQLESYQIPSVDEAHELIFSDENGKEFFCSP